MSSAPPSTPAFDLKSTAWTLTALRLHVLEAPAIARDLDARLAQAPGLFDDDPLVLDFSLLRTADESPGLEPLLALLRERRLRPIAYQGAGAAQAAAAQAAGLVEALDAAPVSTPAVASPAPVPPDPAPMREVEVVREAPVAGPATTVVDKPLRSGQRVYARGDLVVLSVVSFGAEVIADGHIHVYAPLRGRAMAGARGDSSARIFSTCLEPQLVSIAGIYRTTETALPDAVRGRAAMVRLEGEKILVEPLGG
jgi:septum site-determining protein MinC